jgi:hypothetical protein
LNARLLPAAAVLLAAACNKTAPAPTAPAAAPPANNPPIAQMKLPPAPAGGQPPAAVPQVPANDPAANLYGDQGGEETLPPDRAPPGAPLRARKGDGFYRIARPRFEQERFVPFQNMVVDYERRQNGPTLGLTLVFRTPDGQTAQAPLRWSGREQAGSIAIRGGFGPWNQIPRDAELYLVATDGRYEGRSFTFKVSNSVALGNAQGVTLARNWTADEAETLAKAPPPPKKYATPVFNPSAGEDTPLAGCEGGVRQYFLDPDPAGALYGFDYLMGQWENEPAASFLTPILSPDQPPAPNQTRVIARDGYVVGGMTVSVTHFANAFKLAFVRLNADGSVDQSDGYESDWIGTPQPGGVEVKLGNDGRRAIGFYANRGGVHNAVGLVMADPVGRAKKPRDPNSRPLPEIGSDTEAVGTMPKPGQPQHQNGRHVDKQRRPLLGLDYAMGSWAGEPSPRHLAPVYDRDANKSFFAEKRLIAKEGYAVGGAKVSAKNNVNAVKLTFMKLRDNGTLDPADKYESEWIGSPFKGVKERKLGGDGRTVLGFYTNYQAVTHAFGLVMDRPADGKTPAADEKKPEEPKKPATGKKK